MGSALKKTAHAAEQDRPDVAVRRLAWLARQPDLDPCRLVFIDETGASTKMARLRGRSKRGQRCRAAVPHGHWKTTTFTAGLLPALAGAGRTLAVERRGACPGASRAALRSVWRMSARRSTSQTAAKGCHEQKSGGDRVKGCSWR